MSYLGVGLLSAATLLFELALLRLFAVQQFYHFAFMAVSLALLGAGASGSLLSVWPRRRSPAGLSAAFAAAALGAYLTINYLPFDSFSITWDRRQLLYLALYFLAAAAPFLFGGLLVGGELMAAGRSPAAGSHRVYGANLIGSALGCVGSLPALDTFGAEGAVVLAAMLGCAAGICFALAVPSAPRRAAATAALAALCAAGTLALAHPPAALAQRLSPYKTLPVLAQALDARHTRSDWDASARLDVVESSAIHVLPGLSLRAPVAPPPQAGLMLDGDNLMPITGLAPGSPEAARLAGYLPNSLAYHLRPGGRTLVLEAGTGMDVLLALALGAEQVTAVEDNALVIATVRDDYGAFTGGLYTHPRVTVVNRSGRVFARGVAPGSFDVVIVALTDTHRPVTSGAYSLTENYLYTVEAFGDYLRALDQDGLLVVTRWLQTPPSECARTFGALAAALAGQGRDPAAHLLAFRTTRTMTMIASARPLAGDDIERTRVFLHERAFDGVYFPGIQAGELNRYNILPEPAYYRLFASILRDPEATYASYHFDIRPPTDDRPFFFHFFKWRQTPEILATLGRTWQPFGGSGFFVLIALLALVGLASALLIAGPLLLQAARARRQEGATARGEREGIARARVVLYFGGIGLAFLFVEIPLAQRFILVLGQPVTALAVVLFTLLLFSGLGSLTVRRWPLAWGMGALVMLSGLYPLALAPLVRWMLGAPEAVRVGLTVLALAPLGYLMGLPFAGGLRVVETQRPGLVPWAWAINGCASVMSAVLATLLALSWGFSAVLWCGALAYGVALIALVSASRASGVRS
ncbi:MAG TPA: hypothetical protein VNL77_22765 [Roseiflexaceae bacterium]|nr:hypothetical protein [Roseiflexaceae bacterium]